MLCIVFCCYCSDGGGASNAATTDGASAAVEEARRRFLPKMRREASTPEGVYAARDIAAQQELESMERQIDREAEDFEVCAGDGGARVSGVGGGGVDLCDEYRVDR